MTKKAWGGRFGEELNDKALAFSASVDVDQRLAAEDVEGSIAHVRMLAERGIVPLEDALSIERGLTHIAEEIAAGEFEFTDAREDVHMNIEATLTERIGAAGGKLHTARSRNDQVATDMRLFTRRACEHTAASIDAVLAVLASRARTEIHVLMPGYTHLQRAQPVRLSHHLLAWAEMLGRDRGRMLDAAARMNESPLGAAALAGTTFDLDREATAHALGFRRPMRNSLDAVADRDFLVEAVAALANCAVHLSRIGEELVLWSSQEFGFVELSDAFTTGSSIMPQKKNPDVPELVRGKTGRVNGHLVALLTLMKSQPLAYNKDNQEDKEPLFDTVDTVIDSLRIYADMLAGLGVKEHGVRVANMRAALTQGYATATDLADYLVKKGLPFRDAHGAVAKAVRIAETTGRDLPQLALEELKEFSPLIEADVFEVLTVEGSLASRNHIGGTAPAQVRAAIKRARQRLSR